ncbi:DUF4395 domain-containing protein [Ferruginibacter sp. SUN002]|uniref:DUF4395 domain-containing protein n=1 Tax=Ferruginibacter sp. SUN002 TaxID=2937789 RepID=UPI003D3669AF
MNKNLSPEAGKVNENKIRLNALWVFILSGFCLFYSLMPIFIFLMVDFFLRTVSLDKFSLLSWQSKNTIEQLNIPDKPVDHAPKKFAAGIGFALSFIIFMLLSFHLGKIAFVANALLTAIALLEAFFGVFVTNYLYAVLKAKKIID